MLQRAVSQATVMEEAQGRDHRRTRRLHEEKKGKSPFVPPRLESQNAPHLPPNYVSLRDLKERTICLPEEEKQLNSSPFPLNYVTLQMLKEQNDAANADNKEELEPIKSDKVKVGNDSSSSMIFPPNYVTLRHLRDLRLKEQQQDEEKKRLEKSTEVENADEARRLKTQTEKSKFVFKNGRAKTGSSNLVWRLLSIPVPVPNTSLTGAVPVPVPNTSLTGAVPRPVPVPLQDKGGTAGEILTVSAEEAKKKKKKWNSKKKNYEKLRELTGSEIGSSFNEKGKGKMVNLTESSPQKANVIESEIEQKRKGKMVNMQESIDQTVKGFEIKNFSVEKEKGKTVNMQELGYQTAQGSEKGKGKIVNVTESKDQTVIFSERRKWTAEMRGRRDPRVGFVWVPKKSS